MPGTSTGAPHFPRTSLMTNAWARYTAGGARHDTCWTQPPTARRAAGNRIRTAARQVPWTWLATNACALGQFNSERYRAVL